MADLGVELILANSPQAKGRVERRNGLLQDRLVKELRVAGITTMEGANDFLDRVFLPFWEERFTVEPRERADAHRPLGPETDLLRLFAETDERLIREDFTFRYLNAYFQIGEDEAEPRMPGSRITIEHRLDGTVRYRWQESYLEPKPLPGPPERKKERVRETADPPAAKELVRRSPPADHPWRRYPVKVGRAEVGVSAAPPLRSGAALTP